MTYNVHNALSLVKSKRTVISCMLHNMDYDDRTESAKRLEKARINRGLKTAAEAAERFGWSKDTYTQHENGHRGITIEVAKKYGAAFRVKPSWLLAVDDDSDEIATIEEQGLEVIGIIEAGNFRDITLESQDSEYPRIPLGKNPNFPHAKQYALKVSGDSMNKKYPDGSYVSCVEYSSSGLALKPDMVVHIERMFAGTHLVETTLKEIQFVDGRIQLTPRSDNPKHKPFFLDGGEGTEVVVRGVVTGKWEPEKV